ncbi:hypothetical protein IKD48_02860 [bacterium]|nr:hypothetical protein [bacterium]MBR2652179.1 hypothetical protein [bacterium]
MLAERLFNVKTLDSFYENLLNIIKSLGLPIKYTDFNEITNINDSDME